MFIKFKFYRQRNSETTIREHRYTVWDHFMKFDSHMILDDLTESIIINLLEYINTSERKVGKEYVVKQYKNSSVFHPMK